ncbi:M1 family metallopeptidase [uncultured Maribacter sp.]|uniref:M1 family metallopeptidase n=1 Tax=uncultured Maribacter sp. TaxID=431308 RepID=UPI0030EE6F90|tara:strand:+ start:72182 stop:74254 length:2073 start_codon:yes stop_codon:yes gene_type:complete
MKNFFLLLIFCITCVTYGQHQERVDFTTASVYIKPEPLKRQLKGNVVYRFDVKQNVDSIFLDAKNMTFTKVELDGKPVNTIKTEKTLTIENKFKKGQSHKLNIEYVVEPKQTVYFIGWEDDLEGNEQIWTQGQGKYTSHWLPSFDDMEEKIEFDLTIEANKKYQVIANGNLVMKSNETDEFPIWVFDMKKPMSSYLLAFAIGSYDKQVLKSESGISIENYYYPSDSLKVEPTYRYTKRIFDFLENEIGVAYPWQNYKQVPVHDFLYAGMENTSTTFFSDAYVIDSTAFIDRNYVNINAHELAHQWFGNLVTEKNSEHHWLHEGFATYYAYLAEKEVFGEDYFYWKLFDTAKTLSGISEKGEGESLLNPKASSLTFYEKGAWAMSILREEIGDSVFKEGIKNYLGKYQFKNVTVADFIAEMEEVSGKDLNEFKAIWLKGKYFPEELAKDFLMKKSSSIRMFYVWQHDLEKTFISKETLENSELSTELKLELLKQKDEFAGLELLPLASNEDLKIRQFAAEKMNIIPEELKVYVEPLLLDDSYITNELMLYNLWTSFDYDRSIFLDKTKDIIGLPNKNVRLLWLTLALVTPEYNSEANTSYYEELVGYTSPVYNPEVRQTAFQYLFEIQALNDDALTNLIKATNHHSWQFRNFARQVLDSLMKDEAQKKEIEKVAKQLSSTDLRYLKTKLNL